MSDYEFWRQEDEDRAAAYPDNVDMPDPDPIHDDDDDDDGVYNEEDDEQFYDDDIDPDGIDLN